MTPRRPAKSKANPLLRFRDDITKAQCTSEYGSPKQFLPESSISQLVTEKNVKELIPKASPELIQFVCREARRVFLTLAFCWCGDFMDPLLDITEEFQDCGLSDEWFPIENITITEKCEMMVEECEDVQCRHHPSLDAFHDWNSFYVSRFYNDQWQFASPVFTENQPKQILHARSILPITWVNREGKGGHFSEVSEAKLRFDHQDKIKQGTDHVRVAIKELKNNLESGYNVERAWKREVEALDKISQLRHRHLIHRIAALKHGTRYIIIFEWADMGSLRDVWQRNPNIHQELDGNKLFRVLEQIRGLAGALCALHATNRRTKTAMITKSNTRARREVNEVDKESAVRINITNVDSPSAGGSDDGYDSDLGSEDSTEEKHWRHGDLKPDNILTFSGETDWLGTLKIADLGLAKQHDYATNARFEQTDTKHTTLHYEAPEVVTKSTQPRSRRYDIWSMGCIILESMTWLLYGHNVLQTFLKQNEQVKNAKDTLYFTTSTNSNNQPVAEVSKALKDWIEQILNQDPECSHGEATATKDLLKLIRDKLLVVALPEKNIDSSRCRADASTLKHELDRIWQNAIDNDSYLFSRPNRIGVKAPTPYKQSGARLSVPTRMAPSQQLNPLNENWDFLDDNAFALDFTSHREIEASDLTRQSPELCDRCQRLDFCIVDFVIEDSLDDLKLRAQTCQFCQLLLDTYVPERSGTSQAETIQVRRVGSGLTNANGTRALSICKNANSGLVPPGSGEDIQIGVPRLPRIGSPSFFGILRYWLEDCDKHAACSLEASRPGPARMPTRLIDVGKKSSNQVLVCSTRLWGKPPGDIVKYVALSHPWGDVKRHDHFSSTRKNIHGRIKNGIALDELPATFKDAVKVTRELGIRYLWIDSICIVQGDDGDFKEEAKHMETVFSSAYCVIAASRATGTSAGFLNKRPDRKFVEFETSGNSFYVCEAIDDFQNDVVDGPLNKRGWVLQERALARRTIYFTERQTYWECGNGVRCETLSRMTNNKAAFLGDPDFPQVATNSTKGGQIRLYESLYKQYSTLQFTKAYDRPIAIAGLEQRLIRAFGRQGGYGIFERYFGRSLLWQQDVDSDPQPMKEIAFPPQQEYRVPSWSWMAYEGGVTFMDLPFSGVQWEDEGQLRSPWMANSSSSSTWHTGDSDARIYLTGRARGFDVAAAEGRVVYDKLDAPRGRAVKCVVVGSQKAEVAPDVATRTHYVLVVAPRPGNEEMHERVGVGALLGSWISLAGPCLKVHIY
ncbi:hypothetical protein AK830_g10019 [Neonectria ditissima]|uniref:Protein kinase domain-containing protein n=1 Tax=Neonectria ditissima TaxID=78410 RepID=A0A0P7AQX9_9HYPO|nr:hypothetical protein AK830_g10019 [Neonectria ditissima]